MYTLRRSSPLTLGRSARCGVYWAKPKIDAIILKNCTGKSSRSFAGNRNAFLRGASQAPFAFVESKLNQILKEFNSGPCYAPN